MLAAHMAHAAHAALAPAQAPGAFTGGANIIAVLILLAEFGMFRQALLRDQVRLYMAQSGLISVLAVIVVIGAGTAFGSTPVGASALAQPLQLTPGVGSMQSTEQSDALTVMAINPVQYLVSPRLLAGVISFPLLTAVFDVVGIFGGYMVGVGLMGAPSGAYFNGIAANMDAHDIMTGIYKALVFGVIVTWICCYKGYHAQRMATGVSRATTEAVVLSSALILAFDYFLTSILL